MTLTAAQRKKIALRERRQASFHEAGHACVVRRFGGVGVAEIWRNTPKKVREGERAWCGRFTMYGAPGTVQMDDEVKALFGVVPPPLRWRVLVGLAGLVSEKIADGVRDAYEIADFISSTIDGNEASSTDLAMMGDDWTESDVETVLRLLLETWPAVEIEANGLTA